MNKDDFDGPAVEQDEKTQWYHSGKYHGPHRTPEEWAEYMAALAAQSALRSAQRIGEECDYCGCTGHCNEVDFFSNLRDLYNSVLSLFR